MSSHIADSEAQVLGEMSFLHVEQIGVKDGGQRKRSPPPKTIDASTPSGRAEISKKLQKRFAEQRRGSGAGSAARRKWKTTGEPRSASRASASRASASSALSPSHHLSFSSATAELFGLQVRNLNDLEARVLSLLEGSGHSPLTLSENWEEGLPQIGKGSFGRILRSKEGNMAVKKLNVDNEEERLRRALKGDSLDQLSVKWQDTYTKYAKDRFSVALRDTLLELVIQLLLYTWWESLLSRGVWLPTHHPFPKLYQWGSTECQPICKARKIQTGYNFVFKMFLFQKISKPSTERSFEILLQLAGVLSFNNLQSRGVRGVQFMHMDFHTENLMERKGSKDVLLGLDAENQLVTAASNRDTLVVREINCGNEVSIIDFGMTWLKVDGVSMNGKGSVYGETEINFNNQHDLRLYIIDTYHRLCVDHRTFREIVKLEGYALFIRDVVHAAVESPHVDVLNWQRFQLTVDLELLKHIAEGLHLRATELCATEAGRVGGSATDLRENGFGYSVEELRPFFKTILVKYNRITADHALAFAKVNSNVWKDVWTKGKTPHIPHFQYLYAINNCSTPVFKPSEIFNRLVRWNTKEGWVKPA